METALKQAKLRFVRLDGAMDRKQRDASVKQFNNKDRHCVFIISLKAGGTGLNLVCTCCTLMWLMADVPTSDCREPHLRHRLVVE